MIWHNVSFGQWSSGPYAITADGAEPLAASKYQVTYDGDVLGTCGTYYDALRIAVKHKEKHESTD